MGRVATGACGDDCAGGTAARDASGSSRTAGDVAAATKTAGDGPARDNTSDTSDTPCMALSNSRDLSLLWNASTFASDASSSRWTSSDKALDQTLSGVAIFRGLESTR